MRYFGKSGQYMTHLTARTPEEMEHDAQNLLRQGYEEYPSAPPSPDHRWRGDAWVLPPEVSAHQDRAAATEELRAMRDDLLHEVVAFAANLPTASARLKQLAARVATLRARL